MDITEKMYDYLTDKYGAHAADDHFVDCVIYNQETGEELELQTYFMIDRGLIFEPFSFIIV